MIIQPKLTVVTRQRLAVQSGHSPLASMPLSLAGWMGGFAQMWSDKRKEQARRVAQGWDQEMSVLPTCLREPNSPDAIPRQACGSTTESQPAVHIVRKRSTRVISQSSVTQLGPQLTAHARGHWHGTTHENSAYQAGKRVPQAIERQSDRSWSLPCAQIRSESVRKHDHHPHVSLN